VYAMGAGRILYSEPGHTLWAGRHDDDNAVLLELDTPVPYRGRRITHVWYAHLSALRFEQAYGLPGPRVAAGERLGTSGTANGCPHLHVGLLLNRHIRQRHEWLLRDDEIRSVLGYRRGQRLPRR
jgi:murein DD-endopeptidase MepM/ murein hydrolase activator NlpD